MLSKMSSDNLYTPLKRLSSVNVILVVVFAPSVIKYIAPMIILCPLAVIAPAPAVDTVRVSVVWFAKSTSIDKFISSLRVNLLKVCVPVLSF